MTDLAFGGPGSTRPDRPQGGEIDFTAPVLTSIWQHPFAQNVLPMVTSFLFHAGLIVLGLLAATTVQHFREVTQAQIVIPDSSFVPDAEVGMPAGAAFPAAQPGSAELAFEDTAPRTAHATLDAGLPGTAGEGVIGLGANSLAPRGWRNDSGEGPGRLGLTPGPAAPPVTFGEGRGNARRVVFICDASGTMLSSFPMLRRELQESIRKLSPAQSFNVIFFQDAAADSVEGFPSQLVAATESNKQKAYQWIRQYTPQGSTSPFAAIRKAFAMDPELVFVLTDGFDNVASYQQVRDAFDKANPDHKAKVMTLLIRGANDPELAKLLQDIARDHGGRASVITGE